MKKILVILCVQLFLGTFLSAQTLTFQKVERKYARGGSMEFPYVTQAANARVLDSLKHFISNSVVQGYLSDRPSYTLEDIKNKTYSVNPAVADVIGECPECENNTKVTLKEHGRMYRLDVSWDEYCCGAHGNYGAITDYMDKKEGRILPDTAFFKGNYAEAFVKIGEPQIRRDFDIPAGEKLFDHGVGWEEGLLPLATNYVFNDSGIHFYYNKYEVTPWALPAPEFHVSWQQARPYLRSEFLGDWLKEGPATGTSGSVFSPETAVLVKLSGTIAKTQKIKMQFKRLGNLVSGWYYYEAQGSSKKMELLGTAEGSTYTLKELNGTAVSSVFIITETAQGWVGTWQNAQKISVVSLKKD
ncbi:MAG: RsiV family protein [Flavobacteriales bacterium]